MKLNPPAFLPALLFTSFTASSVLAGVPSVPASALVTNGQAKPLREMSTDRPDKTESAYTVDAGHLQIEADLITWTRDREHGVAYDALDVATMNFKFGLTDSIDFQVVVASYHYERTRADRVRSTDEGFGDLTLRTKFNVWGNDGGRTALAIMPVVTLPTASGDYGVADAEAGIIVPLAVELAKGWALGLMTELDVVNDEDGSGHTVHVVNSITVGHDLTEKLGMYVEFFSEIPAENTSEWIGTVDVGFTYAVTENLRLDAGVNVGVTDTADDLNPFLGISMRF
ncbi:transporter [Verrucomicrobium spinosum]|uniref:transporter n=2 Tax=Verrucomicrobium spinosum TaxID=2736 RepID=UPI0001744766|nr:transporter [Verrucomicrobium spinosum]